MSNKNPFINTETLSTSKRASTQLFYPAKTNKHTSILCQTSGPSQQLAEEKLRYFPKIKPKNGVKRIHAGCFILPTPLMQTLIPPTVSSVGKSFVGKAAGTFGTYKTVPNSTHSLIIFPFLYIL